MKLVRNLEYSRGVSEGNSGGILPKEMSTCVA